MNKARFLLTSFAALLIGGLQSAAPTITLEHAWTPEQINWGLMQRQTLPQNHGMLFHYTTDTTPTFWSFNCFVDLSVAYIDRNRVVREIKPLLAHPEKMDPARPVNSLKDMGLYSPDDPIIRYFQKEAIKSLKPIRYVLEMNKDWFEINGVKPGDSIFWDLDSQTAVFLPQQKSDRGIHAKP